MLRNSRFGWRGTYNQQYRFVDSQDALSQAMPAEARVIYKREG